MMTRQQAKIQLKSKGHSYRSAAMVLGVNVRHLAGVLLGERESRSLLHRIAHIAPRTNIPRNSPYRTEVSHA
jgi:hypothetical protein